MWLSGVGGSRQNQAPAGHLMNERISELIGRCRGLWTQMTYNTHTDAPYEDTRMHTPTCVTHTHWHAATVRVMDQSGLKLSWILHGVWGRGGRRIQIERWPSYLRIFWKSIFLSLLLSCCCWQWRVISSAGATQELACSFCGGPTGIASDSQIGI